MREYELERLRLSNATDTVSVSSADLEGQMVNRRVNLKDLVPKFDAKNADINLIFEIFERQAKKEKLAEDRWVSQLIPLLPVESTELVAKEPPERGDDYPHIKKLLLNRFQLTPVALRDRFESHQRRSGTLWSDLVFDLRSYLENWLTKGNYEAVANLNVNSGNEDPFEKFKIKLEINGVERVCLRDSGASIDVCARSWINENDLLGEYVWLKSPLDDVCHCLLLAKIKIKTKGGEFYTKAAIKSNSSVDEPYLLGNRTADLIESSEKGAQVINAVVTRSASKEIGTNLPTANSSPTENADQIPPSEIHEEEMLEIPQVEGMKEFCLANVTSSDFRSEQERCPDLQALWEKARSGVDEEFQLMKGKL
ncbi:retrovirus-related Pol polyprotein from transposon 412, partial [Trichonephila clavata]